MKTDGLRRTRFFFPLPYMGIIYSASVLSEMISDILKVMTEDPFPATAWSADENLVETATKKKKKGLGVWGGGIVTVLALMISSHVPVVYEHAYCLKVSLNARLHCCHKRPSVIKNSKAGFNLKNQLAPLEVCHLF